MAEKEAQTNQLRSGNEPELTETSEKPSNKHSKSSTKKNKKRNGKGKSKAFDENIIRDSETAKNRGRNGGKKSGEVRRAKRDARESIHYLLGRMTRMESVRNNLTELGVEESEFTNQLALQARLFTMALSGNLEAYVTLMKMGGYDPEEKRRERESLSKDKRLERESVAKVNQMEMSNDGGFSGSPQVGMSLDEDDEKDDVIIVMPYNGRAGTPKPKEDMTLSKIENKEADGGQKDGEDNT